MRLESEGISICDENEARLYKKNSPDVDSAGLILGITLLQLLHLLLCLTGIRDLGDGHFGVVALVTGLVFVTAALKALNEGSSLVILSVVNLLFAILRYGSVNLEVLVVRLLWHLLYLLGLRCRLGDFGGGRLLRRLCRDGLILLGLLADGLLRNSRGRLLSLLVAEEIGSTLAGLDLTSGGTIGLRSRRRLGLLSLGSTVLLLLQNGFGGGIFGDLGGFGLDLLSFFRGRIAGNGRS
jgi:hypothetical protein